MDCLQTKFDRHTYDWFIVCVVVVFSFLFFSFFLFKQYFCRTLSFPFVLSFLMFFLFLCYHQFSFFHIEVISRFASQAKYKLIYLSV